MLKFIIRHFTAILVLLAVAVWGLVYLPRTPTWSVLQMKQAIDARDGDAASAYVDFESVVKHAGYEMVKKRGGDNPIGAMVGKAAVDLLLTPMAQVAKSVAVRKVNDGDQAVQMPGAAVLGSIAYMHRNGDTAHTVFKDTKGQQWEIHLERQGDRWRVSEIKNIGELLDKLKDTEQKRLNNR